MDIVAWLHGFQEPAERLLDTAFHGQSQIVLYAIGLVCMVIGIVVAAGISSRGGSVILRTLFMLLALASMVLLFLTLAANLEQCRSTTALVAYQFSSEESPGSVGVTIRQCRTHPVGIADWGPWGNVIVK